MAIRDVVTIGYGNGSFSPGVSKIPTLGYGIGAAVVSISMYVQSQDVYVPGAKRQDVFVAGASVQDVK